MATKTEIENALKVLLNHSNVMSPNDNLSDVLTDLMKSEHRTIQQSFVKEIHDFLVKYSNFRYDLRNEASAKFARDVKELNAGFPFI